MCKNSRNSDVEISSILTVYVYISDNRIIFYLMMSKGPWGGRGAEFLETHQELGRIARSTIKTTPLPPHGPLFIIR